MLCQITLFLSRKCLPLLVILRDWAPRGGNYMFQSDKYSNDETILLGLVQNIIFVVGLPGHIEHLTESNLGSQE